MPKTESAHLELGSKAHSFSLLNPINNKIESLEELKGENGTLIIFMCNHCPFVVNIAEELSKFSEEYKIKGINVIGINSNDISSHPDDSPEKMIEFSNKYKFNISYLFDESQDIAKLYDARCTPDLYLYNSNLELVYHGQFDSSRPGNGITPSGEDLRKATDSLILGKVIDWNVIPSIGCNIKWK
jgi:peroxiredoxin